MILKVHQIHIFYWKHSNCQKGKRHHRSKTGGMLASLGRFPLDSQNFPRDWWHFSPPVRDRWKILWIIQLNYAYNTQNEETTSFVHK